MTGITVASLIAAGVHPTQAQQFADPLAAACAMFDISSPARLGGFVGQLRVESANFTQLEEGLYYRSADRISAVFGLSVAVAQGLVANPQALANVVYAGRIGNGPGASGDGWAYRGRGLIQITGRENYKRAGAGCARDYLTNPSLVAQPSDAALTAAWFWAAHGCNTLADSSQWDAITRAINGSSMLAAADRSQFSQDALMAFA